MSTQEERELQLALAISADEERQRQAKMRAAEAARQRPAAPLRQSPYQLTGRPYTPAEAHQQAHIRNLTLSDPYSQPGDNSIAPLYLPVPQSQAAPYYNTTLYNPFARPPYSATTVPATNYVFPPQAYYQQPVPNPATAPTFSPIVVPGNNPTPLTPATFNPYAKQPPVAPSPLTQSTTIPFPMPPPQRDYLPAHQQLHTTPTPTTPQPALRVSPSSPSPYDSPNATHTHAPLSSLLPPSSPGVGRPVSPARNTPKPLVRETTSLELALSVTNSLGFIRVAVPGDGACLFRAVSERLFGTQRRHRFVRRACVRYMEVHPADFQVFVEGSGYGYNEYLEMMRQETSWGGQIELQAMSMVFSVDFAIYSAKHDPVFIDNGFRRYVALWFSHGSHYDLLYPMPEFNKITAAQELVYWLIARTFDPKLPFRPSVKYQYRNVELDRYEAHVRKREEKDHNLAAQLMSDERQIDYLRVQQENDRNIARRMQEEEEDVRLARALQVSLGTTQEPTVIKGDLRTSGSKSKSSDKKPKSPRSPREKHGFLDKLKDILPGDHKPRSKSPAARDDIRAAGYH